ncbi:MAG TPA: serine hydrolase [Candidatus Woesebacteria bacterium]|nr:serine hydrolase [Candidatus Woesebacteria bacterium]HPR99304.1 serine hydrolase [Candidatus Woesebacteria bacterium]
MNLSKLLRNPYFHYGLFLGLALILTFLPTSFRFTKKNDLFTFKHPPQPVVVNKNKPQLSTNFYILIDNETNQILVSENENTRIYPASTTKLVTALTALNIYPLEEVVTISKDYVDGKVMELKSGDKVTIKTLVAGLLIHSANDAAFSLASHYPQGITGFVDQMNLLTKKYGLKNTHFVNFDGLHSPDHYSTVYDLSQIARIAIQNSTLRNYVKIKSMELTDIYGQKVYKVLSTNELLGVLPEVEGLKTGWTPEASGSFIALLNIDGHYLISVVAQSEDRFNDTKILLNWAKENLTWRMYQ